mgnify:CR=1 FL=1
MSPEDIGLSPSKKKIVGTPKLTKRMDKINKKKKGGSGNGNNGIAEDSSPTGSPMTSGRKSPKSGRGSPGNSSVASSYNSDSGSEDGSGSESGFSGSDEEFERK